MDDLKISEKTKTKITISFGKNEGIFTRLRELLRWIIIGEAHFDV